MSLIIVDNLFDALEAIASHHHSLPWEEDLEPRNLTNPSNRVSQVIGAMDEEIASGNKLGQALTGIEEYETAQGIQKGPNSLSALIAKWRKLRSGASSAVDSIRGLASQTIVLDTPADLPIYQAKAAVTHLGAFEYRLATDIAPKALHASEIPYVNRLGRAFLSLANRGIADDVALKLLPALAKVAKHKNLIATLVICGGMALYQYHQGETQGKIAQDFVINILPPPLSIGLGVYTSAVV